MPLKVILSQCQQPKAESFLIHAALYSEKSLKLLPRLTLIIDGQLGTTEIQSESFQWDSGLCERSEIDHFTRTFNSTNPTQSDSGETTKNCTDTRDSTNSNDSDDSTGTSSVASSQITM